jgi:hypothetical protein
MDEETFCNFLENAEGDNVFRFDKLEATGNALIDTDSGRFNIDEDTCMV